MTTTKRAHDWLHLSGLLLQQPCNHPKEEYSMETHTYIYIYVNLSLYYKCFSTLHFAYDTMSLSCIIAHDLAKRLPMLGIQQNYE